MTSDTSYAMAIQALWAEPGLQALQGVYASQGAVLRLVGGCVRDAMLGIVGGDIDLATDAPPADGMAWLQTAGIKVVPTGLAHGTITAVIAGKPYEITTLRRDVATDGRHAEVAFGTDWRVDAERRDFTINGLFADPDGTIYDDVGGLDDLRAGRVRFIGDAVTRCREDYLRILRLFRFQARFGQHDLDEATLSAVRDCLDGMPQLSAQRVWQEMRKLLALPNTATALRVMHENDVLSVLLDNHYHRAEQVAVLANIETALPMLPPDQTALRRLAMLLAYRTQTGWTIDWNFAAEHFALSKRETAHLRDLHVLGQASIWWTDRLLAALASFDRAVVIDLCLLSVAFGFEKLDDLQATLPDLLSVAPPVFPVRAEDLMTRGYQPGPALGVALNKLRDHWLENNCAATKNECLALL